MKNLFKKNQLMITALAIMIAIAGYLQFAGTNLEEEYLTVDDEMVDVQGTVAESYTAEELDGMLDLSEEDLLAAEFTEIESLDTDVNELADNYLEGDMQITVAEDAGLVAEASPAQGEIPGEAVFTGVDAVTILSDAKLLKEQTRARNKETLLEVINSTGLTDAQKQEAVNSMIQMTEYAEKEAASEILLEAKGFTDVVVSINSSGVDVVVNALELTDVQRAQIEDIVSRKTQIAAENIVISTVVQ